MDLAAAPPAPLFRRRSTLERLALDPSLEIGAGGEAVVRAVPGEPGLVAKLYHEPGIERARKVALMIARPPAMPGETSIAWPCDVLLDARGAFAGFLMPRADGPRVFEFYNPVSRRQTAPWFHPGKLHRAGRNLAAAFDALHAAGYVVGDVNESNILVDPHDASVTLVDADSLQVRDDDAGALFRSRVGKPEFTPPELQGMHFAEVDRAPEHDRFGLAVLLYLLLMEGTHPFAHRTAGTAEALPVEERIRRGLFPHASPADGCLPPRLAPPFAMLDPAVAALFRRAFGDGHADPAARPTAAEWRDALAAAEAALVRCPDNGLHRRAPHLSACPWCERAALLGGRDPFPVGGTALPLPPRPSRAPRRAPAPAPFAAPAPAPTRVVTPVPSRPLQAIGASAPALSGPSGIVNPLCLFLPSLLVAAMAMGMSIQPVAVVLAVISLLDLLRGRWRNIRPSTVILALAMSFAALSVVGLAARSGATPPPGDYTEVEPDPIFTPPGATPGAPLQAPADGPRTVAGLVAYELPVLTSVPTSEADPALPPTPAGGAAPDRAAAELAPPGVATKPRLANQETVAGALATLYSTWDHLPGVTDTATLRLQVGEDGRVRPGTPQLVSATHRAAGEAALAAVPFMAFAPAMQDGHPVPAWVIQRMVIVP